MASWKATFKGLTHVRSETPQKIEDNACQTGGIHTRAGFAEGAGSQRLLDALLAREGLLRAALTTTERGAETHADLAALIETGEVQCGLGLQSAACQLGFLPLITDESFDLVMTRRAYFEPPVQRLLAFAKSDAFAKRAAHLGGYDIAQLGDVIWNG